ncbi:MAG: hypothetical protein RI988_1166 [Pseudomonadota bacterium]|jgi:hypothetical protein
MSLSLKTVPPLQGARWVRDGFRLFGRHPLAFSSLFAGFLLAMLLSSLVPVAGAIVLVAAVPLLSLGFMVASESALHDGPIHIGQFFTPLRGDAVRRRALLVLCGLYAAGAVLTMLVADALDGGGFEQLQRLLAEGNRQKEVEALLASGDFQAAMTLRALLITALSVLFWHAPALVHWGGQGAAQALFSSTLAVWRSKGAFVVYTLTWTAMIVVFGAATTLLLSLLGQPRLIGLVALPGGLILSTVFYVSLLFTYVDSFGGTREVPAP